MQPDMYFVLGLFLAFILNVLISFQNFGNGYKKLSKCYSFSAGFALGSFLLFLIIR